MVFVKGIMWSKESRKKMSLAKKGKKLSLEHKRKISEANKGKIFTNKRRNKISASLLGKNLSEEHKNKLRQAHEGKVFSEKARANMKLAQIKRIEEGRWANQYGGYKGLLERKRDDARRDSCYLEWRNHIRKRDGFKCRIGNEDCKGRLEVHHILGWADYPELRYEINNGITLCHFHHPRGEKEEKRLVQEFQELVSASEIDFVRSKQINEQ